MEKKDTESRVSRRTLLYHLLAMLVIFFVFLWMISFAAEAWTRHGQTVSVPSLTHKSFEEAKKIMKERGLKLVVSDTGWVKTLPPNCVLDQTIAAGQIVKPGRIVYVVLNASETPTITLPDIIDNSSLREAMARLTALGFKLGIPQYVPGEKDWVYGVTVNGKSVVVGQKIPIDATLVIQAGNGLREGQDSVTYVMPEGDDEEVFEEEGEFEEIEVTEEPTHQPAATTEPSEAE